MAGQAPRINNVYYLDVNPIFSYANDAVDQIVENGYFELFREGAVKLPDFQGDNKQENRKRSWKSLCDFSRTFGCVLRDMVLEATGRGHKVDPKFGDKAKSRNRANYETLCSHPENYLWPRYKQDMQDLNSFIPDAKARELVANYDRMNPHFFIEDFIVKFRKKNNNMENMEYDHRVYVFHHREREPEYIHQIDTYAKISLHKINKLEGIVEKPIFIEVKVKTYKKKSDLEGTEKYKQLCAFNDDFIKRKDARKKKYFAGEHEG